MVGKSKAETHAEQALKEAQGINQRIEQLMSKVSNLIVGINERGREIAAHLDAEKKNSRELEVMVADQRAEIANRDGYIQRVHEQDAERRRYGVIELSHPDDEPPVPVQHRESAEIMRQMSNDYGRRGRARRFRWARDE